MGNSRRVKEYVDWRLFMSLFRLCVRGLDGGEKIKEGTLNAIAERLDADVSLPTKFRFLNELVHSGVLVPKGNISWGGKNCVIYRINADALFELFKSTPMGNEAYKAFKSFTLILESPF